jgi:kynurenine formamidase
MPPSKDTTFVYEPVIEKDGLQVSKSPWGPDDEIGRLNWLVEGSYELILSQLDGRHVFDLSTEYFLGMPCWDFTHQPKFEIWMTHTPQGSVNDNLTGAGAEMHERYSYSVDSIHMSSHAGTHIDSLTHFGHLGKFWNGWEPSKHLGSRHWMKGGIENYPPVIARAVVLDIAALHGVDVLPDRYVITPEDVKGAVKKQGSEIRAKDIILFRTGRMQRWPNKEEYLIDGPGLDLKSARYLLEDIGAMILGTDTISIDVLPFEEDTFLPVHCYMCATAGAQIIECLDLEAVSREKIYEFAFLGFPLKLRGATGAPIRPVAVPLK